MAELSKKHFEWLEGSERDPDIRQETLDVLESLWLAVGQRLDGGVERLGELSGGTMLGKGASAWVQTDRRPTTDMVNLTLEIWPGEFSFNVVGWYDETWSKLHDWLRKRSAKDMLKQLPQYDLILFARTGTGSGSKVVWRGAPGEERVVLRGGDPEVPPYLYTMRMDSFVRTLEPDTEKAGAHIRHRWSAEQALNTTDLVDQLTVETNRWLPVLDEINLRS